MKFKEKYVKILKQLKLHAKAKQGKLTTEDWGKITAAYKEKYDSDYYEDQEAYEKEVKKASIHQAAVNLLNDEEEAEQQTSEEEGEELTAEQIEERKNETPAITLEKAKDFYTEQLGFEMGEEMSPGILLHSEDVTLYIY